MIGTQKKKKKKWTETNQGAWVSLLKWSALQDRTRSHYPFWKLATFCGEFVKCAKKKFGRRGRGGRTEVADIFKKKNLVWIFALNVNCISNPRDRTFIMFFFCEQSKRSIIRSQDLQIACVYPTYVWAGVVWSAARTGSFKAFLLDPWGKAESQTLRPGFLQ